MRKNKKFITVMVGLIIIVLLFSVIAIVALYTSPQPTFQIPAQNIEAVINGGTDSEAVLQGSTFTVGENAGEGEVTIEDVSDTEVQEDAITVPQPDGDAEGSIEAEVADDV